MIYFIFSGAGKLRCGERRLHKVLAQHCRGSVPALCGRILRGCASANLHSVGFQIRSDQSWIFENFSKKSIFLQIPIHLQMRLQQFGHKFKRGPVRSRDRPMPMLPQRGGPPVWSVRSVALRSCQRQGYGAKLFYIYCKYGMYCIVFSLFSAC